MNFRGSGFRISFSKFGTRDSGMCTAVAPGSIKKPRGPLIEDLR